jgi:hypothetical protein
MSEYKTYALHNVKATWKEGASVEADGHEFEKVSEPLATIRETPETIDALNAHSHRSGQRYYEVAEEAGSNRKPEATGSRKQQEKKN